MIKFKYAFWNEVLSLYGKYIELTTFKLNISVNAKDSHLTLFQKDLSSILYSMSFAGRTIAIEFPNTKV